MLVKELRDLLSKVDGNLWVWFYNRHEAKSNRYYDINFVEVCNNELVDGCVLRDACVERDEEACSSH